MRPRSARTAGPAGIEACYSTHTSLETARYTALAKEFGLFVTVGSDDHGSDRTNRLGEPECELEAEAAEILGVG